MRVKSDPTRVKFPRPIKVKVRFPAPIQITAEQILREARDTHKSQIQPPPKQKIADSTELADYRNRKRKEFEGQINNKKSLVKYAKWEETQKDFKRTRSIYERAIELNYRDHTIWDRAVTLLPKVNQLWYKYIHMEEMLGNVNLCHKDRGEDLYEKFVAFEKRYGDRESIEDAIIGKGGLNMKMK
uniref:Crooked neck-like protein 1 n=1 Tax=Nicotiana tabacum TaxID=4097 RepID=A0A1S3XSA6_TOBAC|nr:PREDICTED: crooked neck-like protein 1 [Nicotiana tabacum]